MDGSASAHIIRFWLATTTLTSKLPAAPNGGS